MPFSVDPDRPLARSLARIGRGLIASARDSLSHLADDPELAVHDARRDIRVSRAVVRLMRGVIGEEAYTEQNASLRRAAGMLSPHRDAQILVGAFDRLLEEEGDPGPEHSAELRAALHTEPGPGESPLTMAAESAMLELARHDRAVEGWPRVGEALDEQVAEGFARTLRRVRRSAKIADADPTAVNLHNLRKRSKAARDQLRVLMPLAPKPFAALERRLDKVTDLLGESRDQLLLADALALAAEACPRLSDVALSLRGAALERHGALARRALRAAEGIDASPRRAARRLLRPR